MTTLRHAIKVSAPRPDTFRAIADIREVAAWHLGVVAGDVAVGSELYLVPKPSLRFGWRTDEILPGERLRQTCVMGPGTSPGKVVTFALADLPKGGTLVALTDGDWPADDPHLPFCNTRWGEVLLRLKEYVEHSRA
ncbi:SRPBCC family protein [Methylobacterium fujisawaense]|uniref:SRPBCC family protein n=1 Tax=Methylobacterium fujisawaense TaxID=107400 RepID=UPI0036F605DB